MCVGGQLDSTVRASGEGPLDAKTRPNPPRVSGVILAGGESTRFGSNKALLQIGGYLLVEQIVEKLARLSDDLILVTNEPATFGELGLPVRLVRDIEPGKGAIMGVYSGLRAARHPFALTVACDMPFLNVPLLRYMIPLTLGHDLVIPFLDEHLEPLHAIYGRSCLSAMEGVLMQGKRRIVSFFDQVRVRRVYGREVDIFDPQRLSIVNVNTHSDWTHAQQLLARQRRQTSRSSG